MGLDFGAGCFDEATGRLAVFCAERVRQETGVRLKPEPGAPDWNGMEPEGVAGNRADFAGERCWRAQATRFMCQDL